MFFMKTYIRIAAYKHSGVVFIQENEYVLKEHAVHSEYMSTLQGVQL